MTTKIRLGIIATLLTGLSATAQEVPAPAPAQSEVIFLTGGIIHIGDGKVMKNEQGATTLIKLENGKITQVGMMDRFNADGGKIINVRDKHIYPGLIAPSTYIGLGEIDAVRATQDVNETGELNPNVRSIIAYNTDSRVTPTLRSNGILIAETAPRGGRIAGTSSVVQLDAWNWEDAAYKTDMGMHLNWPAMYIQKGWWGEPGGTEANKKYGEAVKQVEDYFAEAKAYAQEKAAEENLRFASMTGLFDGTKKLFVHVNGAREIMDVVDFKEKYGLPVVIVGGRDAVQVADLLKESKIPVIYTGVHALPSKEEEDVDMPYKTPYLLKQAGVDFCLGIEGSWEVRNLPFIAGTASAYGLTKEEALAAITSSTASILGIADKTGTIAVGKDANLIVSSGDLLDMRTSIVEQAFIQGREINLSNKQQLLYEKFSKKYE